MTIPGRLKGLLRILIVLVIAASWGAYLWRNWDSFLAFRWQLDFGWLVLVFIVGVTFWVTLSLLWQRVLLASGGTLGVRQAVRLWATSMVARYVPGGVWHIAGRVYMAEKAGESRSAVFVSSVIEQAFGVLGALLLLVVSLPFWDANYYQLAPIMALALPVGVAVHPAVLRRLTSFATRLSNRRRRGKVTLSIGDSVAPIVNLTDGPIPTPGYGQLLVFLVLYAGQNFLAALSLYLSAAVLGTVSLELLPAFTGAYAIGFVAGYFSFFAPSGLGVREGAIALLLTPMVGAPVAVAAGVLSRVAMSFGEALFVGVVWVLGTGARSSTGRADGR